MTKQAAESSVSMSPTNRFRDNLAVARSEALDRSKTMSRKLSLHTLPALGPSIEIDANDFWKMDGQDFSG
jgi:hypothetical protein